jgi:hypothetical protein
MDRTLRLEIEVEALASYLRETLEKFAEAAGISLVQGEGDPGEPGEPLRNYQLVDKITQRLSIKEEE